MRFYKYFQDLKYYIAINLLIFLIITFGAKFVILLKSLFLNIYFNIIFSHNLGYNYFLLLTTCKTSKKFEVYT